MAKILVAGGRLESTPLSSEMQRFGHELGRQTMLQNHMLLTGCSNSFDRIVAEGALTGLASTATRDAGMRIQSWVPVGQTPAHRVGKLHKSRFRTWDVGERAFVLPEPIANADAVILVGGRRGTFRTANLARIAGKPILPVSTYGGSSALVFDHETDMLLANQTDSTQRDEFEILNAFAPSDIGGYARDIVAFAKQMARGTSIFVVMSFNRESDETYKVIDRVCAEFKFRANRTDKTNHSSRIFSKIVEGIRESAYVIADVTEGGPNVYFELGYAEALGKTVIVVAEEGTELPFDARDLPTIFWSNHADLRSSLQERLGHLTDRDFNQSLPNT